MTPDELKTATLLLDHYRRRYGELMQFTEIGTALQAVTLTFGGGRRITINLASDLSDTETVRVDIIESLTGIVQMSLDATRDHLTAMGIEFNPVKQESE